MNSKNIVPIKDEKIECTCMKCLKEYKKEDMHIIHIPAMGYGSGFDMFETRIILCEDCYKKSIKERPDLWDLKTKEYTVHYKKNDDKTAEEREKEKKEILSTDKTLLPIDMMHDVIYEKDFDMTYEEYLYENEMFNFIYSLPIEGQELVFNRNDKGIHRNIDPQEWIDHALGEASYEVCKKNYWVYQGEIDAYHEKYEKCNHVIDIIFDDGSTGSHCLIYPTVHGKRGGKCGSSYGCYECPYFKERNGELRVIEQKGEFDLWKKNNIHILGDEERIKANIELGIKPNEELSRLSMFVSYNGKNTEELVVIKIEKDKILSTTRKDMQDVLHKRKEAKNAIIKWVSKDSYIDFIGNLVSEREIEISLIEKEGKII